MGFLGLHYEGGKEGRMVYRDGKVLSVKIRDIFTAFGCAIRVLRQASVQCLDFYH